VWAFGNIHGFRDTPRYVAEHVQAEWPDITAWWIAQDDSDAAAAAEAGLKVALRNTSEGNQVQRQAGVAFLTHGFRDLDFSYLLGSYMVFLWHGTPMKRIALDVGKTGMRNRPLAIRTAFNFVHWLQTASYRTVRLFDAASELDQRRFATAFGAPKSRIPVIGSPRFDVIRGEAAYDRVAPRDLRAQLGFEAHHRIVLWLPTHRHEYGEESWLPSLSAEEFDAALGGSDVRLLVKPHPLANWDVYERSLPKHPAVTLLREDAVDVNCLMHIADSLVTDYSSAVFDYSILGRSVQFFAPDVDRYTSVRGLYDSYDAITGGDHHLDWPALLRALQDDQSGAETLGARAVQRVAAYCRNNLEPDVCRRLTARVSNSVGAVSSHG
jgi:CDP-glycerol glycerophosphotransferase